MQGPWHYLIIPLSNLTANSYFSFCLSCPTTDTSQSHKGCHRWLGTERWFLGMEGDCRYRHAWMSLWALVVASGYASVAYCLDLLTSLLLPHAGSNVSHTQFCTDSLQLRELAQGDGSMCVCVCVCLSVCERLSACTCACLCLFSVCACILCVWYVGHWMCVCHVICIVYTWMSRCLLSWHGMIYVCTCECVRTLPVGLSVCVCVQVATVCVHVCLSIVHVARTR